MNGERVEEECWVLLSQSLRDREKKNLGPLPCELRVLMRLGVASCYACIRLRDLGDAILLTLHHVRVRAVFVEGSVVYRECAQGREGGLKSIDMVCGVNTRITRGLKRQVGSECRVSIERLRARGYCGVSEESLNMEA